MKSWLPAIAVIAALSLVACAGSMDSMSAFISSGPWWQAAQADEIGTRARDLEARGELRMALDHWRLVQRISNNQADADHEIKRLEENIAEAVQSHYQNGLAALHQNKMTVARNHFLAALRLDPTDQPALKQIKVRFSPFPLAVYLTLPGDRPASVAQKVFGDEKKGFLVAWFNNLPEDEALTPGTVLILPKLKKAPPEKIQNKQAFDRLTEASARLAEEDFTSALALANQADTSDPKVKTLIYSIQVHQATKQIQSGLLEDARESIVTVPDGFEGKETVSAKLNTALEQRQVSLDLAKAQNKFDQGQFEQCIDQVEALLKKTPDNGEASDLATEARYRLALSHVEHQRYLDARAVLDNTDKNHAASAALRAKVHSRLVRLAQMHYRNGVKHFINEDLRSAITEWEKALACNPDLTKARENIENARRLRKKIDSMP